MLLLKIDEADHILLLTLHRIICDDLSLDILLDELWKIMKIYGALVFLIVTQSSGWLNTSECCLIQRIIQTLVTKDLRF